MVIGKRLRYSYLAWTAIKVEVTGVAGLSWGFPWGLFIGEIRNLVTYYGFINGLYNTYIYLCLY